MSALLRYLAARFWSARVERIIRRSAVTPETGPALVWLPLTPRDTEATSWDLPAFRVPAYMTRSAA